MSEREMLENALASLERGETQYCLPWEKSVQEAINRVKADMVALENGTLKAA